MKFSNALLVAYVLANIIKIDGPDVAENVEKMIDPKLIQDFADDALSRVKGFIDATHKADLTIGGIDLNDSYVHLNKLYDRVIAKKLDVHRLENLDNPDQQALEAARKLLAEEAAVLKNAHEKHTEFINLLKSLDVASLKSIVDAVDNKKALTNLDIDKAVQYYEQINEEVIRAKILLKESTDETATIKWKSFINEKENEKENASLLVAKLKTRSERIQKVSQHWDELQGTLKDPNEINLKNKATLIVENIKVLNHMLKEAKVLEIPSHKNDLSAELNAKLAAVDSKAVEAFKKQQLEEKVAKLETKDLEALQTAMSGLQTESEKVLAASKAIFGDAKAESAMKLVANISQVVGEAKEEVVNAKNLIAKIKKLSEEAEDKVEAEKEIEKAMGVLDLSESKITILKTKAEGMVKELADMAEEAKKAMSKPAGTKVEFLKQYWKQIALFTVVAIGAFSIGKLSSGGDSE